MHGEITKGKELDNKDELSIYIYIFTCNEDYIYIQYLHILDIKQSSGREKK